MTTPNYAKNVKLLCPKCLKAQTKGVDIQDKKKIKVCEYCKADINYSLKANK